MSSIKAKFGADVSEVEAKMLQATRATKAYERAVQGIAKSQLQGGGMFDKVTSSGPKAIETVKQLAGAFGSAGAAAGLVPGLGVAAIGVAALSAGINIVKGHYETIANLTKAIAENEARSLNAIMARINIGKSDLQIEGEKKKAAEDRIAEIKKSNEYEFKGNRGQAGGIKTRELSLEQLSEISKLEADIEESKTAQARILKTTADADKKAADEKSKRRSAEIDASLKKEDAEIAALQEAATLSKMTDEQKLEALNKQRKAAEAAVKDNTGSLVTVLKLNAEIGELEKKLSQERQAKLEEEKKANQELVEKKKKDEAALAEARYKHIWDNATLDEKIAQTKKEGQEAYAKAQKSQSAEDIKALGDLRVKYAELNAEKAGGGKEKKLDLAGEGKGRTRNEKGQLMSNGVVISEEDAIRTERTKAKVLRDEGKNTEADSLLKEIRDYLKPKSG
jgi:hypothetical protein